MDWKIPYNPGNQSMVQVVLFGENVPAARVQTVYDTLEHGSDAVLLLGTSCQVRRTRMLMPHHHCTPMRVWDQLDIYNHACLISTYRIRAHLQQCHIIKYSSSHIHSTTQYLVEVLLLLYIMIHPHAI